MNFLAAFCLVIVGIYCSISWILPRFLAWLFKRRLRIKLQIGRIAIPKFVFKDVNISKNGYSIHIDEVAFRSSFFNSEVTKVLSIIVRDVRINNNCEEKQLTKVGNLLKPLLKQNPTLTKIVSLPVSDDPKVTQENVNYNLQCISQNKVLDFRESKIPPGIITFAQFMSVHIHNLSVMLLYGGDDGTNGGWLLHGSMDSLHAEGAGAVAGGSGARRLVVCLGARDICTRLVPRGSRACLAEVAACVNLEIALSLHEPLNIEKIQCTVTNPTSTINEELYSFLQKKADSPNVRVQKPKVLKGDIFARISPIIPKNFILKIENTSVRGVRKNNHTDFNSSLQNLQVNVRFSAKHRQHIANDINSTDNKSKAALLLPQVYVAFQVDQLKVNTNQEKLLFLNKLKLDAKLESGVLNLYLILNVLSLMYNHENVYNWYHTHFQSKSEPEVAGIPSTSTHMKSVPDWLEDLFESIIIQGCAEMWGVTLTGRTGSGSNNSALAVGCGGLKIKLDQLLGARACVYKSTLAKLLLGNRHWSTELLIDSGWVSTMVSFINSNGIGAADAPHKKQHSWGTALYLGVALVKWGSHSSQDSKIQAMLDCIRLEWSSSVVNAILAAIKCIQDYVPMSPAIQATPAAEGSPLKFCFNVALTNINTFMLIDYKACLVNRVDAIKIDKNDRKIAVAVSSFKLADVVPHNSGFQCQRAEEMLDSFCHLKLLVIELLPPTNDNFKSISIQILENIDIHWNANLHLKCFDIFTDIKTFKDNLLSLLAIVDRSTKTGTEYSSAVNYNVLLKGESVLRLTLSKQHNMLLAVDELSLGYDNGSGESLQWNRLKVVLDDAEIINVDGYSMDRLKDDPTIREERKSVEHFILPWNKVWNVSIASFRVCFPYEHEFAEAVQGDFVTLYKWLKFVHGHKKKPFTADSPLPSDLLIKIDEFILELSDDPFEVKLRDNYELLEDEYKESLKRKDLLDAKVAELCKPHLFLAAGKVEQLYAALRHQNAQIYIRRCRAAPPPRTRLAACTVQNLRLLALADPSIHGEVNCRNIINTIDSESLPPADGIHFSTLWTRAVALRCDDWQLRLRDFPQPLLHVKKLRLWGDLAGAELEAPPRARKKVIVDQGEPWGPYSLERGMMPLKWYHDLNCEVDDFSYAFGACWEPVIAQYNLSWERVSKPSMDPSPSLAWWDKSRLLVHGRLTLLAKRLTCLLHASLNPYNTTEEMELTWTDVVVDWTDGKILIGGSLGLYVRTASKYDDCRLIQANSLRLSMKLRWLCNGEPRDHNAVAPCAPDRLPEYSSNQEHDSYRAFRSQGLDIHVSFETRGVGQNNKGPMVLVYGSTLRWFESLKTILSGVTRPTRRGALFGNVRQRKPQLSRHYRAARLSVSLHSFQVTYWASAAMQRGLEIIGGRVSCGSEHSLSIVPWPGSVTAAGPLGLASAPRALQRRPRSVWTALYVNCELADTEMWLKCALAPTNSANLDDDTSAMSLNQPVEKCYCLSVGRVSYGREASAGNTTTTANSVGGASSVISSSAPTHRLTVMDLRGAWTKTNREVAFALFDTYMKNKQLKKNLSTKALKDIEEIDESRSAKTQHENDSMSPPLNLAAGGASPGGGAEALLAQLVAEAGSGGGDPPVVFSDDLGGEETRAATASPAETQTTPATTTAPPPPATSGPHSHAEHEDETAHIKWLIALVNSQVLVKGCETRGYVLLCAARAEVRQRVAVRGTAWAGALTSMQYYATVTDPQDDNIQWVSAAEIEERGTGDINTLPDVPRLVGSGHSAGGVVGSTVGPTTTTQLQRIVSRCACEFYYVSYDDDATVPPLPQGGVWGQPDTEPCDTFRLMHHDLDVCTNSLQYAMLLDVVNNLVLYVDPQRRRALERRARMRFQLQLNSVNDPKAPIQDLQHQVRGLVARLRQLERESYLLTRAIVECQDEQSAQSMPTDDLIAELHALEAQVQSCKEQLWLQGEELDAMIRCRHEAAAAGGSSRGAARGAAVAPHAPVVRLNEICFKSARWRLTDADGQLGIADLVLTNFLYTKTSRSDDSVEHQLELGYLRVTNLLPREPFAEVLVPTAPSGRAPLARRAALRVFCRDRPAVGGISVKEHFEVNLVPITLGVTKKFFNTMLKFCFPERDTEAIETEDDDDTASISSKSNASTTSKKSHKKKQSKDTNFYVKIEHKDDVEKMKERAEKNKLFIYIKIPEVPVRVSYKGSKEKNLEDVRDMPLVLPTLEYHNVTWTWLDMLLAMKSDTRRVILAQAIRQRLQLHRRSAVAPEPQEEDKARLLLGDQRLTTEAKPQKKSSTVFKFTKS